MRENYNTVLKEAQAEITEKKSSFIANVKNVKSEEEALEYIEVLKRKYWDARHNVYAYYIGEKIAVQKCSDDGEPSGTAGMPILEVLKKEQLEDVVVVVTRYFGGILLGTGGLVRAYSKSAKEGIIAAGIGKKVLCGNIKFRLEYSLLGKLNNLIAEKRYKTLEINYADLIDISVAVPVNRILEFSKQICELTSGELQVYEFDRNYYITEYL